jgi:hypothetical protein
MDKIGTEIRANGARKEKEVIGNKIRRHGEEP